MAALARVDEKRVTVFNSMYGGYVGNTTAYLPPPVVQMSSFWDEQKIEETATPRHIHSHITNAVLQKKLDEPLNEDLTDATYLQWIVGHAKRLYLILAELGCAEKIFDLVDGSWDDDDLPLSEESLQKLGWGSSLEKKFAKKQQFFVVRKLEKGQHLDYSADEVVPLEVIFRPTARLHSSLEKVYFPRHRDVYYSRRRVSLGDEPHQLSLEAFMEEVRTMNMIRHAHIVSLECSYTQHDIGYFVLSPCIETNLKTFMQYPTIAFKDLPKDERRRTLINWIHCLSDALAYLSEEGIVHGNIKPSSIVVDSSPRGHLVYLADIGNAKRLEPSNTASTSQIDVESYEYAAPELWSKGRLVFPVTATPSVGRGWRRQAPQSYISTSSTASDDPISPTSPVSPTDFEGRRMSRSAWPAAPASHPSKSDVFSLGCVFLDILSFHAKRKTAAFASHRAAKNRRPRETGPPDASFHANTGQVESWIEGLEKRASKKNDAAAANCLLLSRDMMAREPEARPEFRKIADRAYRIVLVSMAPAMPHCGLHTVVDPNLALFGGWDNGLSGVSSESGGASRMGSVSTGVTSVASNDTGSSAPKHPLVGI